MKRVPESCGIMTKGLEQIFVRFVDCKEETRRKFIAFCVEQVKEEADQILSGNYFPSIGTTYQKFLLKVLVLFMY